MVTRVSQTATIQDVFISDTKGNLFGKFYCGPRIYSLAPNYSFLALTATDTVTLTSTDPLEVGTHAVTLTISLQNYPLVPAFVASFDCVIECEVFTINSLMLPPLSITYRIGIDSLLTYPVKFAATPACDLVYSISPAVKFAAFNSTELLSVRSLNVTEAGLHQLDLVAAPVTFGSSLKIPMAIKVIDPCAHASFYKQTIASVDGFLQDPSFNPSQTIRFDPFLYDVQEINKIECGEVQTSLIQLDMSPAPSWIKVDFE